MVEYRKQQWNVDPAEAAQRFSEAMEAGQVFLAYPIGNGRYNVASVAPALVAGVVKYAAMMGVDWLRDLTRRDRGDDA